MKAKTRILALLLTVLMVVGILPLSLFALDAEIDAAPTISGNGTYEKKTVEEIQAEFEKVGMNLARYLGFEKLDNDTFKSFYNAAGQVSLGTERRDYVDYDVDNDGDWFTICDQKLNGLTIVTEGDGNRALYFGKPTSTNNEGSENYISAKAFSHNNGDRYQDMFISFDVKMEGDTMAATEKLVALVYRAAGDPYYIKPLGVKNNGELYLADGTVVGKLSKDSYTKISVMTDRVNNKYYVYINDVLVNLGGTEFFTADDVEKYNTLAKKNFAANTIPLDDIRLYIVKDTLTSTSNVSGVYLDNIFLGNRYALRNKDTNSDSVAIQSNFAGATPDAQVYPTSEAAFGAGWNKMGGSVNTSTIVYVDDGADGIAMKYTTADEKTLAANNCQTFVGLNGVSGQNNISVSASLKLGAEGIKGSTGLFWHDINIGGDSTRKQLDILGIDENGNVKWGDYVITTISKDKYTNIRVDIVVGGMYSKTAFYFVYVDDVLTFVGLRTSEILDDVMHVRSLRFYNQYSNGKEETRPWNIENLKEDDLHVKDIVVKYTSAYNNLNNGGVPFAKNPLGFAEYQGKVRYFDGKGGYAVEDFFIGTTKYMVGTDGEIINKIVGNLPDRSLTDIQEEFDSQGIDLRLYQSFENTGLLTDGATKYEFPYGTSTANQQMPGALDHAGGGSIYYKHYRSTFDLVTEADGNVALLHRAGTEQADNNDNYFDIQHGLRKTHSNLDTGNGSHDLYLSVDVKMNGSHIVGANLFTLLMRYSGSSSFGRSVVELSEVGGIYLGGNTYSPDTLLGYLSKDEYTRIAFSTDRLNNKFYVYINDVCVTPEGETLFTEGNVKTFNEKNTSNGLFTAETLPIAEVRVFSSSDHNDANAHAGIYFDNITYGARQPFTDKATATANNIKHATISGIDTGVTLPANGAGGVFNATKLPFGITGSNQSIGTWSGDGHGTIRYVDETGDGKPDAIELHKDMTADSTTKAQAFFQISTGYAAGTNLSVSGAFKAGQSGTSGKGNLIQFRYDKTIDGTRYDIYPASLKVDTNNNLIANTVWGGDIVIGKLTTDTYTYAKIDVINNSVLPTALFYVGYENQSGEVEYELKATMSFSLRYSGKGATPLGVTDFQPNMVRFFSVYGSDTPITDTDGDGKLDKGDGIIDGGDVLSLKEQDVRVKAISFGTTSEYDTKNIMTIVLILKNQDIQ